MQYKIKNGNYSGVERIKIANHRSEQVAQQIREQVRHMIFEYTNP